MADAVAARVEELERLVEERVEFLEVEVADLVRSLGEFRRLAAEMAECAAAVAGLVPDDEDLHVKLAEMEAMFTRLAAR